MSHRITDDSLPYEAPRLRRAATPRTRHVAPLLCALTLLLAPAALHAQADRLDPHILIDALADEGMSELLLHLIETEPPDDPVVARQIEIAQQRIRYRDTNLDLQTRHAALREALAATRRLIDEYNDHHQRPIWQTDLAEMRLTDELQVLHEHADLFYEFGVPTPEQRDAYASAAVEALEATGDAARRLFELRGDIGRDEALSRELHQSGMFTRLFEEYEAQRTPFFYAHAAYATACLGDDHDYFANLGTQSNPRILDQRSTPAEERERLLDEAIEALEPLVRDADENPGAAALAMALSGRALVRQARYDEGIEMLQRAAEEAEGGRTALLAQLGHARALHKQADHDGALAMIGEIADRALVREQPLFQLLVTDAEHRVLMAVAEQRTGGARDAAIAAAYQPYMTLLDDPSIEQHGQALRHYVYRRWERTITDDADLARRPPVVRLGIAQMARLEGQRRIQQARQAGQEPPAEALEQLRRAVRLGEGLRGDGVDGTVQASAMFNEAVARFWIAPNQIGNRLAAAQVFVDLAAAFPDYTRAEDAIANAVTVLRQLHQMDGAPAEVERAYIRAAEVLFDRFAGTAAAADERLYYAFSILQRDGDYAGAAEMYAALPSHHADYFEARRERLHALRQLYRQAQAGGDDEARETARQRVVEAAEQLGEEAEAALAAGERIERAQRAAAGARLVLADMIAAGGGTERALALLVDFEQDFPDEPDLVAEALEQRILMLVDAGQQAQQRAREAAAGSDQREHTERAERFMARAVDEARRMSEQFPDDAAAVIDQVLTQLETRIEQMRTEAADAVQRVAQQLRAGADQLATVAAELADTLVQWAQGQGYEADEMLPFRLIQAKSLRLAGDAERAVSVLEPMMERFGDDAGVIGEYADALFARGDDESLMRAARYYDRLITGLQPPYPDLWWNAWARRLQINEQLGRGTETIAMRVRQLRLTDPDLGGPPYRAALEQLEARHGR